MKERVMPKRKSNGAGATHSSYGNQFVEVVNVDVDKDAIHPGEDFLGCGKEVLGKGNSWNVTSTRW